MRVKNFLPMNLQLFAEPAPDDTDTLIIDEVDEFEPVVEEDEPAEEGDEPAEEVDPEPEPEPKSTPEPTDETEWVKKRLARAERAYERKFLEEAASQSDGIQLERQELPKAVKLWNVLKHNPYVSKLVDEVLRKAGDEGKLKTLTQVRPDAKLSKMEADFDLREVELELKYSDPVFKKYSEKIKDWAEDEGLDVSNPKTLKLALKAWKQDNAALILADRPKIKAPAPVDPTRKSAKLVGGKSSPKGQPIDYRKASDGDILKHLGVSLFSDD